MLKKHSKVPLELKIIDEQYQQILSKFFLQYFK